MVIDPGRHVPPAAKRHRCAVRAAHRLAAEGATRRQRDPRPARRRVGHGFPAARWDRAGRDDARDARLRPARTEIRWSASGRVVARVFAAALRRVTRRDEDHPRRRHDRGRAAAQAHRHGRAAVRLARVRPGPDRDGCGRAVSAWHDPWGAGGRDRGAQPGAVAARRRPADDRGPLGAALLPQPHDQRSRHLHARPVGRRHRAVGHQGSRGRNAGVAAPGRCPFPGARVGCRLLRARWHDPGRAARRGGRLRRARVRADQDRRPEISGSTGSAFASPTR